MSVRARIEGIVAVIKDWPSEAVIGATKLDHESGFDDMDREELRIMLENEFDIALEAKDVAWCKTVDDVVTQVSNKVMPRPNP